MKKEILVGSSVCLVLFALLSLLKIADFITWSWLWIASPLWLPMAFLALVALLILTLLFVYTHNG